MIFGRPDDTPYDLAFTLFGTRIRVHPLFWVTALLLGSSLLQPPFAFSENGVPEVLIWVAAPLETGLIVKTREAVNLSVACVAATILPPAQAMSVTLVMVTLGASRV